MDEERPICFFADAEGTAHFVPCQIFSPFVVEELTPFVVGERRIRDPASSTRRGRLRSLWMSSQLFAVSPTRRNDEKRGTGVVEEEELCILEKVELWVMGEEGPGVSDVEKKVGPLAWKRRSQVAATWRSRIWHRGGGESRDDRARSGRAWDVRSSVGQLSME